MFINEQVNFDINKIFNAKNVYMKGINLDHLAYNDKKGMNNLSYALLKKHFFTKRKPKERKIKNQKFIPNELNIMLKMESTEYFESYNKNKPKNNTNKRYLYDLEEKIQTINKKMLSQESLPTFKGSVNSEKTMNEKFINNNINNNNLTNKDNFNNINVAKSQKYMYKTHNIYKVKENFIDRVKSYKQLKGFTLNNQINPSSKISSVDVLLNINLKQSNSALSNMFNNEELKILNKTKKKKINNKVHIKELQFPITKSFNSKASLSERPYVIKDPVQYNKLLNVNVLNGFH